MAKYLAEYLNVRRSDSTSDLLHTVAAYFVSLRNLSTTHSSSSITDSSFSNLLGSGCTLSSSSPFPTFPLRRVEVPRSWRSNPFELGNLSVFIFFIPVSQVPTEKSFRFMERVNIPLEPTGLSGCSGSIKLKISLLLDILFRPPKLILVSGVLFASAHRSCEAALSGVFSNVARTELELGECWSRDDLL